MDDIYLANNTGIKWKGRETEYCLHIVEDPDPFDPLEMDNAVTLAIWHRKYTMGNVKTRGMDRCRWLQSLAREYAGAGTDTSDVKAYFEALEGHLVIMPVWMMDHSGISLSCADKNPYADPYDSGLAGYAYISKESVIAGTDKDWKERGMQILKDTVALYDDYLNGNVWEFNLLAKLGGAWESIQREGGFYGDSLIGSGIMDALDENGNTSLREALASGAYESGLVTTKCIYDYDTLR